VRTTTGHDGLGTLSRVNPNTHTHTHTGARVHRESERARERERGRGGGGGRERERERDYMCMHASTYSGRMATALLVRSAATTPTGHGGLVASSRVNLG